VIGGGILALSLLCATAKALSLQVAPVIVERGSANILRLTLKPEPRQPVTALQWDIVYPQGLKIEAGGLAAGSAAESTDKVLTCGRKPVEGTNHRLTCILAGGWKPLPQGVIAIIRLEASRDAPKGNLTVGMTRVSGVSPALQYVPVQSTQTAVTIR
jgi:hypothetical protein